MGACGWKTKELDLPQTDGHGSAVPVDKPIGKRVRSGRNIDEVIEDVDPVAIVVGRGEVARMNGCGAIEREPERHVVSRRAGVDFKVRLWEEVDGAGIGERHGVACLLPGPRHGEGAIVHFLQYWIRRRRTDRGDVLLLKCQ